MLTLREITGLTAARAFARSSRQYRGLGHVRPDRERRERSIGTMSMIAFILAALAALLSIIYVRPTPAQDAPPAITRSL